MSVYYKKKKKKEKRFRMKGIQLNIFLVRNFLLLIIGAAGSCMPQLLTFPYLVPLFAKRATVHTAE